MKNYPNQASRVSRLRDALRVIDGLNNAGQSVGDNAVFGYEAARQRAYTFSSIDLNAPNAAAQIEARIIAEQALPANGQGALTYAREMRRTLRDFGWLDANHHLTVAGQRFLEAAEGSPTEQQLLEVALLGFELDPGPSHPVRILLGLLALGPSTARRGLELALEVADDSAAEFARVEALYHLPDADRRAALNAEGVSNTTIANAKKIFPALAVAAGLAIRGPGNVYSLSPRGAAVLAGAPVAPPVPAPPTPPHPAPAAPAAVPGPDEPPIPGAASRKPLRPVAPEAIAATFERADGTALSEGEQLQARAKLNIRTEQHQGMIRSLALMFSPDAGEFHEGSVDLLWASHNGVSPVIVVEGKTIDNDAYKQIRDAVGQLLFYEYFDVSATYPDRTVRKVVAVNAPVGAELAGYLTALDIGLILVTEEGWSPLNELGAVLDEWLGPPQANGQ